MNVNLHRVVVLGISMLGSCAFAMLLLPWLTADPSPNDGETPRQATAAIVQVDRNPAAIERRLRATTRYLASDDLAGRGILTPQLDLAAQYIAREFDQMGLKTDLYDGTAFQEFAISRRSTLGLSTATEAVQPGGGRVESSLKNVIGLLEGSDAMTDETIVVGAHYDHLGMGGSGTLAPWTVAVHNGADDNASGTAMLIEVARRLSARRTPLRRRIVFIAFTAEESGLLGSEHYVGRPLVPLSKTVAMVNMDMVGRLRSNRLTVYGTGTAAEFSPLVRRLASAYQLQLDESPGGYGPSDHASFHARGIPVLHFFTGLHEDYHRPSDDYEKLNYPGLRRIAQLVEDVVTELAQAESAPRPVQTSATDLLASLSSEGANPSPSGLAITVRDRGSTSGCIVTRVVPNGVAHRAGLRVGDALLRWGEADIRGAEHLRELAEAPQAGTSSAVVIMRGGLKLELEFRVGGE